MVEVDGAETDDEHGLFLVEFFLPASGFGAGGVGAARVVGGFAVGESVKGSGDLVADGFWVDIAVDSDDAVCAVEGAGEGAAAGGDVEGFDGGFGAVGGAGEGFAGEDFGAGATEGDGEGVFFFFADGSELMFFDKRESVFWKGRVEDQIREEVDGGGFIAAHDFGAEDTAMGVGGALQAATEVFEFGLDLSGGAVGGAFEEELAGGEGDASVGVGFGEDTGEELGAEGDEGEAGVGFDEESEAVEVVALGAGGGAAAEADLGAFGGLGFGFGADGDDADVFGGEVVAGDFADTTEGEVAHGLQVTRGEVEGAGDEPGVADGGGLAFGRDEAAELAVEGGADGFGEFVGLGAFLLEGGDNFEESGAGGVGIGGVALGFDLEEAALLDAPGAGPDVVGESAFFAELLVEAGGATGAEEEADDIESGFVGVGFAGGLPADGDAGLIGGEGAEFFAAAFEGRFGGEVNGFEGAAFPVAEEFGGGFEDFFGVERSGDDDEAIVGHVMAGDEGGDVSVGDLIKDGAVTDDGVAEGVFAEGGGLHEVVQGGVRVVMIHGHFPADDVLFAGKFGGVEPSVADHVREDVEVAFGVFGEAVDPVDGAVEGSVGIDVAAALLDVFGDVFGGAFLGAFEEHVFDAVGEASTGPVFLVDGTGANPELNGDEGVVGVFAEEDFEAVGEGVDLGVEAGDVERGFGDGWDQGMHGRNRGLGVGINAAEGRGDGVIWSAD